MKPLDVALLSGCLAFVVDVVSKSWALQALVRHEPVPVLGNAVTLNLGFNTGIAFGVLAHRGPLVVVLTGLIIAGLLVGLAVSHRSGIMLTMRLWPIGLILGGAVANFLDRLPDGRVTDFLTVGLGAMRSPAFNFADTFILAGMALVLVMNWSGAPSLGSAGSPTEKEVGNDHDHEVRQS